MPAWKTTDQYRYYAFSRKFWKDVFIITSLTFYHLYIKEMQHGFQPQKNCSTQLIQIYHNILEALDKRNVIDSVYLDFSKAFDKVSHPLLLQRLEEFGFRGQLMSRFRSYLSGRKQRVMLEGQ